MTYTFNSKKELYPYNHEYYFGFFKDKTTIKHIHILQKFDIKYTYEYFSFELYLRCLKNNIKPSKLVVKYILNREWRKAYQIPYHLRDNNIECFDLMEDYFTNDTELDILDNKITTEHSNNGLVKKITDYVKQHFTKEDILIFNLYFIKRTSVVSISKKIKLNKSTVYNKINRIKKILKAIFYDEYCSINK